MSFVLNIRKERWAWAAWTLSSEPRGQMSLEAILEARDFTGQLGGLQSNDREYRTAQRCVLSSRAVLHFDTVVVLPPTHLLLFPANFWLKILKQRIYILQPSSRGWYFGLTVCKFWFIFVSKWIYLFIPLNSFLKCPPHFQHIKHFKVHYTLLGTVHVSVCRWFPRKATALTTDAELYARKGFEGDILYARTIQVTSFLFVSLFLSNKCV